MKSEKLAGLIAINIAALIFGSAALAGKLTLSPFFIVLARSSFASLCLLAFAAQRGELTKIRSLLQAPVLVGAGLLAVHWLTFFYSVQSAGVAVATLTFSCFPAFSLAIDATRERRIPSVGQIAAVGIILLAISLLVDAEVKTFPQFVGALSGLISAFCFARFGLQNQSLLHKSSPVILSLLQNTTIALALSPYLIWAPLVAVTSLQWLCLAFLGVFTTAIMHQLYFFALRRLSATTCSGFVALEPVYAILFAHLLFGDPLKGRVLLGGFAIVGASFALLKSERRPAVEL